LELTQGIGPDQQCKIALCFDESTDPRHYNLPTTTSNEIAVILSGDGDQPTSARDIVLHRHGGGLKEISYLHPLYPSLHYVLLFITEQLGWNHNIPYDITADNQDDAVEDEEGQKDQGGQRSKRKTVSQAEYSCYHLFPQVNESNHIFMAGKLFQEYTVDSWATSEQSHLNWVRLNQTKLKAETYKGLTYAVVADPTTDWNNIGQCFILPSSFSGSSKNMIQHCQDALAIKRYFHGADLFLTMTANPNWPKIKETLLPGQSAADHPDLVVHVFRAKVEELKRDIFKNGFLGKIGVLYTPPGCPVGLRQSGGHPPDSAGCPVIVW